MRESPSDFSGIGLNRLWGRGCKQEPNDVRLDTCAVLGANPTVVRIDAMEACRIPLLASEQSQR